MEMLFEEVYEDFLNAPTIKITYNYKDKQRIMDISSRILILLEKIEKENNADKPEASS